MSVFRGVAYAFWLFLRWYDLPADAVRAESHMGGESAGRVRGLCKEREPASAVPGKDRRGRRDVSGADLPGL